MLSKSFLSSEEKQILQRELYANDCPHVRQRALILILKNDGKTHEQVALLVGCSTRTVAYWAVHGDPSQPDSLRDKREDGNYRKATPAYIAKLEEVVEQDPLTLGYEFSRWSAKRLAQYLAQETGILLSASQVQRILQKKTSGISGLDIA